MNLLGLARQVFIFFYEVIKFLCWLLPLLFFSFLALSFLFSYLFPDFPIEFIETTVLSLRNFELGVILLLMFVLTILGIYFRHREKKIMLKFLPFKSRDETIVTIITSFFFSTFFIKSFFEFKKLEPVLIIFLTFFFFALLPQFLLFYSFVDLGYSKKLISSSIEKKPETSEIKHFLRPINKGFRLIIIILGWLTFLLVISIYSASILKNFFSFEQLKIILILLLAFVLFLLIHFINVYKSTFSNYLKKTERGFFEIKGYLLKAVIFFWGLIKMTAIGFVIISLFTIIVILVVVFLAWQLNRYTDYQRKLRENLTIMSVVPATTTLAQKVRLEGYNFGWKVNKGDKLMSNYGKVVVDEWKGEELIFIVPLHWKEGIVRLWIERNKDDLPEGELIKSNVVRLKILSRWDFFPAEEELRNKDPISYLKRAIKKIRRALFLKAPYFP